ncbi:MAG: PKD domain-containing protein [Bacteroidota bacterium]
MASKLKEITTKYHTFVDNQVLTKDQLNEFINYFDDQDRITRVFLHGVGIVCGFKVSKTSNKITLTPGVGVTTDGDLLLLKKAIEGSPLKELAKNPIGYSFYKTFTDDSANYQPFRKLVGTNYEVIDMWELLPEEAENSEPLTSLPDINDKVVLLYLESFPKEGDLCTAIDCDNQGIEQVNRLRVLLVSKTDAEYIAGNDSVFSSQNVIDNYFNLPSVAVKRVVLNQINSSKYEELKRAYYEAIKSGVVADLADGIDQIVTNFKTILQLKITSSVLNAALSKLKKNDLNFSAYKVPFDVQYRYDFLKDVVDTYNEIKSLLLELKEICFPDITAFPKHLMLGRLDELNKEPKHLRHSFYKSPALTCGSDKIEKCKNLVTKLLKLIDYNIFKDDIKIGSGEIKITPSNKLTELSTRAIPFYYKVNNTLLKLWNYEITKRFEGDHNLSYHKIASSPDQVRNPLEYNIDKFDFFRIEGHQGKDYRDVMEKIDELKTQHGLSFDVKALSININRENLDIDDYECEFEDLKVMLKAWTAEQDCILAQIASFFSSFSTTEPGTNVKESELDLKKRAKLHVSVGESRTMSAATSVVKESYQPVYMVSSVVSDNLSTTENTLGIEMKLAIEENKGGSVNDIIAGAQHKLKDKVDTEAWNADPEMKTFIVEKGVELMAHTHVLTQRMPVAVAVVDTTKVTDYKLSLAQLCELVKKLKAGYQSVNLSVGLRAFIGLLINQLSTVCCSGKKLEILLEEVNKRKEQILVRLQLSKFIEIHPGLEHLAGVEPGGTFVLVYYNKEKSFAIEKAEATEMEASKNVFTRRKSVSEEMLMIDKLTSAEKTLLLRNATDLLKYEDYRAVVSNIESLEKVVPPALLPNNTVVADFALPYMCCSDCAPINYIIAKPPATLRLEKDRYCLLTDTEPILFEVSPADGVVQSDPVTEGLTIESNRLLIVPDSFPEDMLGKPIRFTVNSQVTDAELTVYMGVQADFSVPEGPTSEATHTFVPTGTNLDGAKFLWDFGDGNTSTERNPTHTYKLPVNEDNKVTVTLNVTAANGICKATVEHSIEFEAVKLTISLPSTEFCENDKNTYSFTVTPANIRVGITGEGVIPDGSGGYVFIPANAGLGDVAFNVNGELSEFTVQVVAAPKAAFTPEQADNTLVLTNQSTNATTFEWSVNGNKFERNTLDPVQIELTPDSPAEWKLSLAARGAEVCPTSQTKEIVFNTKYIEEPPVNTCIDETKAAMAADHKVLHAINPEDIVVDIWNQTAQIYGGTADFKEGVLDQVDLFLKGGANGQLEEMFIKLLMQTAETIASTDRERQKVAFTQLVQLFELQLRLFYNILGCQNNETIKEFQDMINNILGQILEVLTMLKQQEVIFSDQMKEYIAAYQKMVAEIEILKIHIDLLINENLI